MSSPIQVSPATNDLTLSIDQTLDEVVKVTIPKSEVVAKKVDVYFLADTTGSMKTAITAVKGGISTVLTKIAELGADVQFGVAEYKDFPAPVAGEHPYAFAHQPSLSANIADVQAAINAWKTTPGQDTPEAQLYALDRLAEPPGGKIGWRADSKRIVVWFGDAAGHDPVCQEISKLSYPITEESLTAKLVAEKITVLALSMNTNYRAPAGLDDNPQTASSAYQSKCGNPGGTLGQGTRIANATGGKFVKGVSTNTIIETIIAELKAEVTTIGNVRLVASAAIAPFVKEITPVAGYGPLSTDQDHEIAFNVSWVGTVPCTNSPQIFNGSLDVVVDGQVVGGKTVKITVPASVQPLPPISIPKEEIPMPRPDDVSGNWMLIHQVTGTYLETDNYTCAPGEAVQTWHEDPPRTQAGLQGHLWVLSKQTDGTYRIRSWQKNPSYNEELYLEASANTTKEWNAAYPRMQRRSDSDLQSWVLVPVSGDSDTYAIQPKLFPDYALGTQSNYCIANVYVIASRTWGRPTFHHYWRLSAPLV